MRTESMRLARIVAQADAEDDRAVPGAVQEYLTDHALPVIRTALLHYHYGDDHLGQTVLDQLVEEVKANVAGADRRTDSEIAGWIAYAADLLDM